MVDSFWFFWQRFPFAPFQSTMSRKINFHKLLEVSPSTHALAAAMFAKPLATGTGKMFAKFQAHQILEFAANCGPLLKP